MWMYIIFLLVIRNCIEFSAGTLLNKTQANSSTQCLASLSLFISVKGAFYFHNLMTLPCIEHVNQCITGSSWVHE